MCWPSKLEPWISNLWSGACVKRQWPGVESWLRKEKVGWSGGWWGDPLLTCLVVATRGHSLLPPLKPHLDYLHSAPTLPRPPRRVGRKSWKEPKPESTGQRSPKGGASGMMSKVVHGSGVNMARSLQSSLGISLGPSLYWNASGSSSWIPTSQTLGA